MIVKCNVSFSPGRNIPSLTLLPFSPLSLFIASLLVTFFPTKAESSTSMIRSPAIRPTFSDGPPGITLFTCIVSSLIVNCIPIPLKCPLSPEFTSSKSFAGIYEECGSSSERINGMVFSTRSVILTVSTYESFTILSNALILLDEPFITPNLFPE